MSRAETSEFEPMEEEVTQDMINRYAELSGDFNPLHVDPEFAKSSEFGGTIAHGPIQLQPCFRAVSAWLGSEAFPSGATVSVTYRAPARPGDRLHFEPTAVGEDASGSLLLEGRSVNQHGDPLALVEIALPGRSDG